MSRLQRERLVRRILAHHLPLCALSASCITALYCTRPYRDALSRASFATAYPALILLAATLLVGPLNILRRRRNPVSSDLRRDIGIWAGILGVLHSAVGQNVHLRGRPWLYYIYSAREGHAIPIRHDLFGFANHTGLAAFVLVVALLATSNDYSLRRLGTARWKQLQRWNYAVFALVAVHTVAYQVMEKQRPPFLLTAVICTGTTIALQSAGFLSRRAAG